MDLSIIKILGQIFANLGLQDYVYKPNGKKIGNLTPYDYSNDPELSKLLSSPRVTRKVGDMEILGIALPIHGKEFLNFPEGRVIVNYIVKNSSYDKYDSLDFIITSTYGDVNSTGFDK